MSKKTPKKRHDYWLKAEQSLSRYKGLNAADAEWLKRFNVGWAEGSLRAGNKFAADTVEEKRELERQRYRRRQDAQNTAMPIKLPIVVTNPSPEDALIDALDLSRDEVARMRRLKAAEKADRKRELARNRKRKQRIKEKMRDSAPKTNEPNPVSGRVKRDTE